MAAVGKLHDFELPGLQSNVDDESESLYRRFQRRTAFPERAAKLIVAKEPKTTLRSPNGSPPPPLLSKATKNFDKRLMGATTESWQRDIPKVTTDPETPKLWSAVNSGPQPLYRRRPLWSWKQRQAARVKKRGVEESNDVSAVSLHSSKTISEKELSRMLAVNKKDSSDLLTQSRVRADEHFASGYDKFMCFKPKLGSSPTKNKEKYHAFHNTQLLSDDDLNSMVIVRKAAAETRPRPLGRIRNLSAPLPSRCHSPVPRVPFTSRASSAVTKMRAMSASSSISRSPAFPTIVVLPQFRRQHVNPYDS
ncbi:uncharacterized protein [Oscarella lobularis]|uniref:uncharacterized protein isoform X2 n=1 Tax=Oscarella lobularis TaxID=121494 RepID=UPI003313237F